MTDYAYRKGLVEEIAKKEKQRIEKYIKRRIRVLRAMAEHNRASDIIWTECKIRISELEGVLDVVKKEV